MIKSSANSRSNSSSFSKIVPITGLVHPKDQDDRAFSLKIDGQICPILISSTYIRLRITELAHIIIRQTRKKNNDSINLLIVLKGAAFFGCQLAREIYYAGGPNIIIHFVSASSYGNATHSSDRCRITGKLNALRGKDVIVVEDICDTGLTLIKIKQRLLKKEHALSVKTCVLLDKPTRRLTHLKKIVINFIGFKIPDVFVAGFGLDHADKYRELPFVVAVSKQGVKKPI